MFGFNEGFDSGFRKFRLCMLILFVVSAATSISALGFGVWVVIKLLKFYGVI
jgi:hypothetical protein